MDKKINNDNNNSSNKNVEHPEMDPFKKASRLARSPVKVLSVDRPVRAKSSPPALQENTPSLMGRLGKRDHMTELGEMIQKLAVMMHPPQRSINNPMRELLSSIAKLHACAKEEHARLGELKCNVPSHTKVVEITPKRPRDGKQMGRRTPPKKTKTAHEVLSMRTVVDLTNEGKGSHPKDAIAKAATGEEWVTVQSRTQKKKVKKNANTTQRLRPDAIVIAKVGEMTYADILRTVKTNGTLQELGKNVTRVKKTAKGEILLELKKEQTGSTEGYKEEISRILGDQAQIKTLKQETTVELRDLDDITTKDDIAEAIRSEIKELGLFSVSAIKTIRAAYAGTQIAVISLPAQEAKYLLQAQKIKIGWTICRIREKAQLKKCFRCLEYGHVAKACSNLEDRSKCCIKCGEEGHFAKSCTNNPFCIACKKNGKANTEHQIGSRKCPIYIAACSKNLR